MKIKLVEEFPARFEIMLGSEKTGYVNIGVCKKRHVRNVLQYRAELNNGAVVIQRKKSDLYKAILDVLNGEE